MRKSNNYCIDRNQILDLIIELIKIPSPYFHEQEIMEFVFNWLNKRKVEANFHEYYDEKITKFRGKNVIGRLKGNKRGIKILLNGHLDTVNVCDGWTKEPFKPQIVDNKLYGLGALDMKAGCAAIMCAIANFKENVQDFKGEIVFQLVSDEEGPYGLGSYSLVKDGFMDGIGVAIIPEPSSAFIKKPFPCLCLGARGGYNYTVNVTGKSAHAATPELGISAIEGASNIMLELLKSELRQDDKLGKGSIYVIDIKGGGQSCSVAESASFSVFRHTVTGEDKKYLEEEFENALSKANTTAEAHIKFRPDPYDGDGGFVPYTVDSDNLYANNLLRSINEITGKEAQIGYFSSIGDFNTIAACDIPVYVFGPDGGNFHSPDEYVLIDSAVHTSQVIYDFLINTCID